MAEMALRQQHTEQVLQQTAGALQQSQQQQAAAATVAGQSASMDTRLLGKPERWNGEDKSWKDWRFVTRAYLMAALPSIHDLLDRAENGEERVTRYSVPSSLKTKPDTVDKCYVLVLLVTGRALDKVQGAGEGEGAAVWEAVHEH